MIYFNTDQYRYTVSDLLLLYIYKIKIKVYHKTLPQFKTNYSWFQSLASTKRKKHTHTHNIKNRKFNCSLHTKKTNNTNKLPFYPYKNLKITKLKKRVFFFFFWYRLIRSKLVDTVCTRLVRLVFKLVRNSCVLVLVLVPEQ